MCKCEAFKTDKELVEGRCPNHPNVPLRLVEEENYFFRLSAFGERLLQHYEAHPEFIQPETRRNEILNLVNSGLQDIAITRKGFTWGIPVPFDPEQTIYVWFDALFNYITAIGYGSDEERFQKLWPADVHVIGKDITRFHCALWPAMLMSAGLPLPKRVFAHGFVYNKGAKISKSSGNAIDPMDVFRVHGADAFNYYFMRRCPSAETATSAKSGSRKSTTPTWRTTSATCTAGRSRCASSTSTAGSAVPRPRRVPRRRGSPGSTSPLL